MLLGNILNGAVFAKSLYDMYQGRKNDDGWVNPDDEMKSNRNYTPPPSFTPVGIEAGNSYVQPIIGGGGPDINQLKALAVQTYPDNPIMQQVALSQAILESGSPGKMSGLATKQNNLFGIKGSNTAPGTASNVPMNTTEYGGGGEGPNITRADFSANNNLSDSFNQHRQLLSNLPRYQSVLNAANPTDAFNALQKSGYATDPNYSSKLNNVFSKYVQPLYY